MPQYDVECTECRLRAVIFRKIEERDLLPVCSCGGTVRRILTAPMLAGVNFQPFISPGTGEVVDSPTKWKEDLRKSGAIPYEKGMREDIARNRGHEQEKAFRPIEKAVDEIVRARLAVDKLEI